MIMIMTMMMLIIISNALSVGGVGDEPVLVIEFKLVDAVSPEVITIIVIAAITM